MSPAQRIRTRAALSAVLAAAALCLAFAGSALAQPAWRIDSIGNTTAAPGGSHDYLVQLTNTGDTDADGTAGEPIVLTATLPPGITAQEITVQGTHFFDFQMATWTCSGDGGGPVAGASVVTCTVPDIVGNRITGGPSRFIDINATAALALTTNVAPSASGSVTASFQVSGAGAPSPASTVDPTRISPAAPEFGIDAFDGQLTADAAGDPSAQAGGHPYSYTTSVDFNTQFNADAFLAYTLTPSEAIGSAWPVAPEKDVVVDLPPGLVGSQAAAAECTSGDLVGIGGSQSEPLCAPASQVGTVMVRVNNLSGLSIIAIGPVPVYNMVPSPGAPASFGFNVAGTVVTLDASLRSGSDYGLSVNVRNAPEALPIAGTSFTFWGVPSDPSHTPDRGCPGELAPSEGGVTCASGTPPAAFLRNPTSCAPEPGSGVSDALVTGISIDSWEHPGAWVHGSYAWHEAPGYPLPESEWGPRYLPTGCEKVPFTPELNVIPSAPAKAGAPSGMTFEAKVPQTSEPAAIAQGDVERTVVTLPKGLTINPAAASGLSACSEAQIGYTGTATNEPNPVHFDTKDPECPESSKVAAAELETPLLKDPLKGEVYQAAQNENPFHSLFADYLVVQGQGITIKLAGEVHVDPATGQITATFDHTPQAPFSNLKLTFKEGPRALFILPPDCGTYTTASTLDSWSGASVSFDSKFTLGEQSEGGCAPHPFAPAFTAGTVSPDAATYSPFVLSFSRTDQEQQVSGLTATLAPGQLAKLAGVTQCSDQDAKAGTCPASSQIGTVLAGSGAGPSPFFLKGQVYLTGPYNGGPFGEVVVVPAIAGPFNLGNVVVRGSIRIDSTTAQATVLSAPFPQFVGDTGVPTDVRRVDVTLDRPGFTFNPTDCSPKSVTGALSSVQGATEPLNVLFQAHNCATLPFHPSFRASTQGKTSKAIGASLHVHLGTVEGPVNGGARAESNIAKVDVQLPVMLPSRLPTLQKACTADQFAKNPAGCPEGSFVGVAIARTPLLANPLSGPAILVSHGGVAFPDVVLILQGEGVTLDVTGHTQIKKGITFSHFDTVPDAPVTSFDLTLPQGPHGVLTTDIPGRNLCATTRTVLVRKRVTRRVHGHNRKVTVKAKKAIAAPLLMPTTITAQNGAVIHQNTRIAVTGCSKVRPVRARKTSRRHR